MLGVVTVKRSSRRFPGVTPPSIALHNPSEITSFFTRQWLAVAFSSTIKSGMPTVSIRDGSLYPRAAVLGATRDR
jgi:hypothetical protein